MAEQFAFQEVFGQGPAIHGDKGTVGPWALGVYGLCHEALARACLAGYQDIRVCFGHIQDQIKHIFHGLRLSDQTLKAVYFLDLVFEHQILFGHILVIDDFFYQHSDLIGIERLEQVVPGTVFHGLDGCVYGPIGSDHDHSQVMLFLFKDVQEFKAIHARHLVVEEHNVIGFLFQEVQGSVGRGRDVNLVPVHGEPAGQGFTDD